MKRLIAFLALLFLFVPAIVNAAPKPAAPPVVGTVLPTDRILGNAKAKITIIEYGSVACPICARFNDTVMPDLKSKYITTGKVRYIFRPMLTGVRTIAVAGTRLAECAGKDKYFDVVDTVMRAQSEYYAMGENNMLAAPVLKRIAGDYGFNEDAYNKCVLDQAGLTALNNANNAAIAFGVNGTPAFFINGQPFIYKGTGIAEFDAAIAAAK